MLFQLLEETPKTNTWISYVLIGVLVVILIGSMFFMNRRSKKRDEEAKKLMDAVKPGNKVKTIGGICGIVVEVNAEDETFVLETGSETSGKCYMKFVKQAILESDAVIPDDKPAKKGEKTEESPAETAASEPEKAEETASEPEKTEEKADKE